MKKISIVIPVYNEAESVAPLHAELVVVLQKLPNPYEIIFVDDGSIDRTFEALKKLSPVKVIRFRKNFGKSQALQAGFDKAQGDYIITLDGDLQDDPKEIPRFLEASAQGLDLVVGWKQRRLDPGTRRFVSKIANLAAQRATGTTVQDMNSGYKLYVRDAAKGLLLYGDMHRYIPSIVAHMGYVVGEIPVNHRARRYGRSKYGLSRVAHGFFDFSTLLFVRKFMDRPMYFFGFFGILLSAVGTIILGHLSWIKIFSGAIIGNRPLLMLGILFFIVGFQSFSLGLIGELVIRQSPQNTRHYRVWETIHND